MDWTLIAQAVVDYLVVPALLALLTTLGAWLLTKLPGPVRDWFATGTRKRDLELLLGALARRGLALAVDVAAGRVTREAAARAAVEYARANVPGTLAKLAPAPAALDTMAEAAVTAAVAQVLPGLAARGEGIGR